MIRDIKLRGGYARGFTMLEILVVVFIIGLMAAAGGGMYVGSYKKSQLVKSAKEVMLAAKYARLAAVEKQQQYKLYLDSEEGRFFISYKEIDPVTETEIEAIVSNPYSRPGQFPESVKFEEITISPASISDVMENRYDEDEEDEEKSFIVFTPYGTADNSVIKIGNGKTSYLVCVSAATGKAKVVEYTEEGLAMDVIDLDLAEI